MKNLVYLLLLLPSFILAQSPSAVDLFVTFGKTNEVSWPRTNDVTDVSFTEFSNSQLAKTFINSGFNYSFEWKPTIWLKTGLRTLSLGSKTIKNDGQWPNQHDGDGGFDPTIGGNPHFDLQFKTSFHYIEIPLAIRKEFRPNKTLQPFIESGVSACAYLISKNVQKRSGQENLHEVNYQNDRNLLRVVNAMFNAATGVQYKLNDKIILYSQFNGQFQLFTLSDHPFIKTHFYTLGMELGVRNFINK